jgi:hypothetical protein
VICGVLGAIFVEVYSAMGVFRKKYVNTNFKKIIEVLLFSLATRGVSTSDSHVQRETITRRQLYSSTLKAVLSEPS